MARLSVFFKPAWIAAFRAFQISIAEFCGGGHAAAAATRAAAAGAIRLGDLAVVFPNDSRVSTDGDVVMSYLLPIKTDKSEKDATVILLPADPVNLVLDCQSADAFKREIAE